MAPLIIDDQVKLESLLANVTKRTGEKCLLFVDLEGVNLGRNGSIAIMQILVPPDPIVYLVDAHVLGSKAFDLTTDSGTTLQSLLECNSVFKVFFDIRNDSDALHAHFGIDVAGIIDLQVIEYTTRPQKGKYVNRLANCIQEDLPYNQRWLRTKAEVGRLFKPQQGGSYAVFLERPIMDDIAKYCEQDVLLTPQLLALYGPRLEQRYAVRVQGTVDARIKSSKSISYNGKGRHKAIGFSLWSSPTDAATSISPEISIVRSPDILKLCQLDSLTISSLATDLTAMDLKNQISSSTTDASQTTHRAASVVSQGEFRRLEAKRGIVPST